MNWRKLPIIRDVIELDRLVQNRLQAEAWDEGFDAGASFPLHGSAFLSKSGNPYRKEAKK